MHKTILCQILGATGHVIRVLIGKDNPSFI